MPRRAAAGASLEQLLTQAIPLLQQAQRQRPRTGPGAKPTYLDWTIAAMIFCGVLKNRKSKSSQYRFICQNRQLLVTRLKLRSLPARSTFFARYPQVWPLVQAAIAVQGRLALREHAADATVVAVDKSLIAARGPVWHKRQRQRRIIPKGLRGVDQDASWGYSDWHDWVWGYSFEVLVTAPAKRSGKAAFALLASVDVASASEQRSFVSKIPLLPPSTRFVAADSGYDGEHLAEAIEQVHTTGRPHRGRTRRCRKKRRRFLCPLRNGSAGRTVRRGRREQRRQRRVKRAALLQTRRAKAIYARRKQTVEPFNAIFKRTFELDEHVWHRGLDNNRTQILMAIFCHQLLVRYQHRRGQRNAQIQSLLDGL